MGEVKDCEGQGDRIRELEQRLPQKWPARNCLERGSGERGEKTSDSYRRKAVCDRGEKTNRKKEKAIDLTKQRRG